MPDIITLEKSHTINSENEITTIDLQKINDLNLKHSILIKGVINISENYATIKEHKEKLNIDYTITYENENVTVTGVFNEKINKILVSTEMFLTDVLEALNSKKEIVFRNLRSIKAATDLIKNQIYDTAFENNLILVGDEFNKRVNIYNKQNELVGIGNRLICCSTARMIVGECIFFKEIDHTQQYTIETVLEDKTLNIMNVAIYSSAGDSIKYVKLNTENGIIGLDSLDDLKNKEPLKICNINTPTKNNDIDYLYNNLLDINSQQVLNNYYRFNKKANVIKIDVNKYMIS